jgi:hypothetical protein
MRDAIVIISEAAAQRISAGELPFVDAAGQGLVVVDADRNSRSSLSRRLETNRGPLLIPSHGQIHQVHLRIFVWTSDRPRSVNAYSACGGLAGTIVRVSIPSRSSPRRVRVSICGVNLARGPSPFPSAYERVASRLPANRCRRFGSFSAVTQRVAWHRRGAPSDSAAIVERAGVFGSSRRSSTLMCCSPCRRRCRCS